MIITDFKILHQPSRITNFKEVSDLKLEQRLIEANKTAWTKGAGLAAIQIGVPLRFSWAIYKDLNIILLNPEITQAWGEDIQEEGCLSIPNKYIKVKRAWTIKYVTGDKKRKEKKVSGFMARLIQHEIDHMDGVLITDKGV